MNKLHYKIKLTVESPIYIGNSLEYTKLDFFEKDNYIHFVNHQKFFKVLEENNLFNTFFDIVKKEQDLIKKNLKNKNSPDLINKFYLEHSHKLYDAILYKLPIIKSNRRLIKINSFVKNADNEPYIPGSSIKGAIRTAIMEEYNINSETQIKGLLISDSKPININNLIVLPRKNEIFYQHKQFPNNLELYNEYLKEGTELEFTITLDLLQLNQTIPNIKNINDILNLINKRYKRIINILDLTNVAHDYTINKDNLLFLGGQVGFHSKTILDKSPIIANNKAKQILTRQFKHHKHNNDNLISPRTYKIINTSKGILFVGLASLEVIK